MNCPHCQAPLSETAQFCPSCGKAVRVEGSGPRIVEKSELATSLTGQSLQAEELKKLMRRSFGALLAVAILQTLSALVIGLLLANQGGQAVAAVVSVVAVIFYGLAFWARKQPFPAAVTGLSILFTLWLADAVIDPTSLVQGILVKLIILGVLIRAVQAGLTYRKLSRRMAPGHVLNA